MLSKAFETEFFKSIALLSKEQQSKVLSYVKTLLDRSRNTNQKLLQFAGAIEPRDTVEIANAIEAGCEKVDKDEW